MTEHDNILFHRSRDCVLASNFIEDLPLNLSDLEQRALVISVLEKFRQSLESVDIIEELDIQTIRLYCSKILDLIDYLEKKNLTAYQKLVRYLKECLNILEKYITSYYHKVGYLPDYSRYEKEYYGRYYTNKEYYPVSYYYWSKYPSKNKPMFKYLDKTTGQLELDEETKDQIFREITSPDNRKEIWDRPDMTFEELMAYTLEKLSQKYEEIKAKEQEQEIKRQEELSKDPLHAKMDYLLNVWLPYEKRKWDER